MAYAPRRSIYTPPPKPRCHDRYGSRVWTTHANTAASIRCLRAHVIPIAWRYDTTPQSVSDVRRRAMLNGDGPRAYFLSDND